MTGRIRVMPQQRCRWSGRNRCDGRIYRESKVDFGTGGMIMKRKKKGLWFVGVLALLFGTVIFMRRAGKDIRIKDYL